MGADSVSNKELTVCDIMGEWGAYQWSVTLFALLWSALLGTTVVIGPIWTPDIRHVCADQTTTTTVLNASNINFANNPYECVASQSVVLDADDQFTGEPIECTSFIYDDENYGKVLTNTFDLVCSRQWLRSFLSSAALTGMLLSSVTLGLLSDKHGRMSCIQAGCLISILATIGAILANNYFLLNICFMLISYAQVGAANALCTLVMESTSPRYRFVPVFEYGFGWGLGVILTPLLHRITKNYQHFLIVSLVCQLVMLVWLRWGVFESIRWLLSEGKINRAQIELQRACRMNLKPQGAELAQKIAQVQVQQMRKASCVIDDRLAPARLAQAWHQEIETTTDELNLIGRALRKSFALSSSSSGAQSFELSRNQPVERLIGAENGADSGRLTEALSPTLVRESFSMAIDQQPAQKQPTNAASVMEIINMGNNTKNMSDGSIITTQGLAQLAVKYSNILQQQEEGTFFVVKMFHKKLYKLSIGLMLLSIMLETSYYGLIQANKFVGSDVELNYIVGGIGEWISAALSVLLLWVTSRHVALIAPTFLSALACLGMALAYQLIPNQVKMDELRMNINDANITGYVYQMDSVVLDDNITTNLSNSGGDNPLGSQLLQQQQVQQMVELREVINFWLMTIGKVTITVSIQVAATIAMETYPNNLRQTGPGAIVLVGRIGSILAPFLFNDNSEDKLILKITLVSLACIGTIVCFMVPLFLRDTKDQELCDRLNEIEDT